MSETRRQTVRGLIQQCYMPLVNFFLCYVASLCLSRFLYSHLTISPHAETMPTSGQPSPPFDLTVQPESLHNDRPQSKLDIVKRTKIRVQEPSKAKWSVSLWAEIVLADFK